MEKQIDKKGKMVSEVEDLQELVDREGASLSILLSAASGDDQIEEDDIVMITRDSLDRVEKMKESLERLDKLVRV